MDLSNQEDSKEEEDDDEESAGPAYFIEYAPNGRAKVSAHQVFSVDVKVDVVYRVL